MSVERLRISVDVLSVVLRVHVLMHALAITHVLSLVRDLNVILADCKVLGWQLNLVSVEQIWEFFNLNARAVYCQAKDCNTFVI